MDEGDHLVKFIEGDRIKTYVFNELSELIINLIKHCGGVAELDYSV